MVQARLAGRISDCLRGVPQGDCWGVLLWSPWSDPGSKGVEQVSNQNKHISHSFSNNWHVIIYIRCSLAHLLQIGGHWGMVAK